MQVPVQVPAQYAYFQQPAPPFAQYPANNSFNQDQQFSSSFEYSINSGSSNNNTSRLEDLSITNSNTSTTSILHAINAPSPIDTSRGNISHVLTSTPHYQRRKRRRYCEIKRYYKCSHEDCQKSYGTLNHLNFHIQLQGHGPKRSPAEFKHVRQLIEEDKRKAADVNSNSNVNTENENGNDADRENDVDDAGHTATSGSKRRKY
jgi:hypothetical protein